MVSLIRLPRIIFRRKFLTKNVSLQSIGPACLFSSDVAPTFKHSDLCVRLAAPEQLQDKPDFSQLKFGQKFTDHMLKVLFHKKKAGWETPAIMPLENLSLHPAAKVLHYAVELFEGMKAFRGCDGRIRLFRPDLNMKRMNESAVRSGLPTFDGAELVKCIKHLVCLDQEWVPHSESSSLYIRPTLIGIDPALGVASCDSAMLFVILCPVGPYFDTVGPGISLLADPQYTRACPGGVGDKKMGSNYAPTIFIHQGAIERGLQQVLWLYGDEELVTEVGTMNIMMFHVNGSGEKELVTPPLEGLILPGVTRASILDLTREWNRFKITERNITMAEIVQEVKQNTLLELFGCGTACVVTPIKRIEYRGVDMEIPTLKQEKPLYAEIMKVLTDIQYGHLIHPWAVPIDE